MLLTRRSVFSDQAGADDFRGLTVFAELVAIRIELEELQ